MFTPFRPTLRTLLSKPASRLLLALTLMAASAVVASARVSVAHADNTAYYVNNQSGANCNDRSQGTDPSAPWCDFTPVNNHGAFGPGDQILLARGATWNQELDLTGAGSASASIKLDAYGSGANPRIIRTGAASDRAVRLTNPSYWSVNNLEVGSAGAGILVYYTTIGNQSLAFNNIYAHDITGIHQGGQGTQSCAAGSDQIWNSAGIEITGLVTLSGSQYALQGLTMNDIRGTHNLDTVSLDWCNGRSTTTGGDGSNTVQNVTLSNLYFHDDNGDNNPNVGCDEGFRLSNATNATVFDSYFDDESACHSDTGTASIFFGGLKNVVLVNDFEANTPATNSPDQTGFDYEGCDNSVYIRDSYIGGNAGAGVEVLAYYGSACPLNDVQLSDNAYVSDGNGAVERIGSTTQPTGTISGNLYSEPAGFLTTGNYQGQGDFSGFQVSNNQQATSASAVYNAARDFSSAQGQGQWSYQYTNDGGASWGNLGYDSGAQRWDLGGGIPVISQFDAHPGQCGGCYAARAWTAPSDGVISVRGRALKADTSGGNGVGVQVILNGQTLTTTNGQQRQTISSNDQVGVATDYDNVQVHAGDIVRFVLDDNGNSDYDLTSWDPSIAYTSQGAQTGGSTTAFNRYYNNGVRDHWVTTGSVTSGYNLESTQGYLYTSQQSGTVPLYGCQINGDHFISNASNCEGYTVLRTEGYIYSSQPSSPATIALYRCFTGSDHFISGDPNCEGQRTEYQIGYALSNP